MIETPSAILMRNVHQFKMPEVPLNSFPRDPLEDLIVLYIDICPLPDSIIFASKFSYGMPSGLEKSVLLVENTLLSVTPDYMFRFGQTKHIVEYYILIY